MALNMRSTMAGTHRIGGNRKRRSKIIRNRVFDCHLSTDKWQSKTLFISIFDPRSMIVKRGFDCCIYTLFNEGKTHLPKIKLFYHVALNIKYIFT